MSKQKVGLLGIFVFVLGSFQGNLSAAAERVMTARELREAARQGGQAMYTRSGARLRAAADARPGSAGAADARAALAGMDEKEKEELQDKVKALLDYLEARVNAFANLVRKNPAKRNEIFADIFNEIEDKNAEWFQKDKQGADIPGVFFTRFNKLRAKLNEENQKLEGNEKKVATGAEDQDQVEFMALQLRANELSQQIAVLTGEDPKEVEIRIQKRSAPKFRTMLQAALEKMDYKQATSLLKVIIGLYSAELPRKEGEPGGW